MDPRIDESRFRDIVTTVMTICLAWEMVSSEVLELIEATDTRRKRQLVTKRGSDDIGLLLLLFSNTRQQLYGKRRFWMDTRSQHWVFHVVGGLLLQEHTFQGLFQMSRASFNNLLNILGSFFCPHIYLS